MGVELKKTNKPIAKLLHAAGLDLYAATLASLISLHEVARAELLTT